MPTQVYRCKDDGEFDIVLTFKDDVASVLPCPDCGMSSPHILQPPGIRIMYTWNDQANASRRDPYTQAKAQLENTYHEQKDMGQEHAEPTEEGIQAAAALLNK